MDHSQRLERAGLISSQWAHRTTTAGRATSRMLKKPSVAFSAPPLARRDSLVAHISNGLQHSKWRPVHGPRAGCRKTAFFSSLLDVDPNRAGERGDRRSRVRSAGPRGRGGLLPRQRSGLRVSNRMKPYGQSRDADRSSSIPPVTSSILQQSARLEPKVPENSEDPFSLCPRLRDAGAGAPGLCRKPAAAAER